MYENITKIQRQYRREFQANYYTHLTNNRINDKFENERNYSG